MLLRGFFRGFEAFHFVLSTRLSVLNERRLLAFPPRQCSVIIEKCGLKAVVLHKLSERSYDQSTPLGLERSLMMLSMAVTANLAL